MCWSLKSDSKSGSFAALPPAHRLQRQCRTDPGQQPLHSIVQAGIEAHSLPGSRSRLTHLPGFKKKVDPAAVDAAQLLLDQPANRRRLFRGQLQKTLQTKLAVTQEKVHLIPGRTDADVPVLNRRAVEEHQRPVHVAELRAHAEPEHKLTVLTVEKSRIERPR